MSHRILPAPARVLAGAAILFAALSAGAQLPPPFTATLSLKTAGATIAGTRWSLTRGDDGVYVYESVTEPRGLYAFIRSDRITERSRWRPEGSWLQPLSYRYERTGGKRDRRIEIAFDWESRKASHVSPRGNWSMTVPEGTLDKLNYLIALMQDLSAGKTEFEYVIADGGRLKTYRLEHLGVERIETALGPLEAAKIRRIREGEARKTMIWCARAYGYLPVRVEHHEDDGISVILEIDTLEGF